MNRTSTERILFLLKTGDTSVLESIYKTNREPFLNFAKKFNLPKDDVIDIYQDAIIALRDNAVLGKVETLESTLQTYLFSIGKYMIYRKLKTISKLSVLTDDVKEISSEFVFFDFSEVNMAQRHVNLGFAKLGTKCQEVLKLFYYDGLKLEEIREYLGYDNYNVVKSQKSRCLKSLRLIIEKESKDG